MLVEALLFVIVINIAVQLITKKDFFKYVKYTRIGYFAFWAFWAMTIFSGLVVFAFQKGQLSPAVFAMIAAAVLLPILDGYRAVKLGKLWQEKTEGLKFSILVMLSEIAIIALTIVYTVLQKSLN